jgi:hypothetical protein
VISLNGAVTVDAGDGRLHPDAILTAVETSLRNDAEGVELRFHKESGLLFVTGTRAQCQLAEEVVNRLRSDIAERGRQGQKQTQEMFRLAHTDPMRITDALRVVFPADPASPDLVKVVPEPNTNSVMIAAPENLMVGVRAVIRSMDRRQEESEAVTNLRAAEVQSQRQAEQARMELAKARDELARCAQESTQARSEVEITRLRAEEIARMRDASEKSRLDLDKSRSALQDELMSMRAQLAASEDKIARLTDDSARFKGTIASLTQQLEEARKPK